MSNKDKTNTKVIEQPVIVKPAESTSHPILGGWVQQTKDMWQSCKRTTKEYLQCDTIKEINIQRKQFVKFFCHPIGSLYRSFPQDLTTLKFNLIGKYDYHQRLVALQAATLLIALSSLKIQPNVGHSQRMLFAFRNSAIFFALGGLIVAPQIYNSLVKSDF